MSILNLPQARIPIGSVTIQGQKIPVEVDMEWMMYFITLTERAGGVVAPSNLYQTINTVESVAMSNGGEEYQEAEQGERGAPGKDGAPGRDGISIRGQDGDDSEPVIYQIFPNKLEGYTVAQLPTGSIGMRAYVTDATAPTYRGALVGGGAVVVPVFHNGTAWVSA